MLLVRVKIQTLPWLFSCTFLEVIWTHLRGKWPMTVRSYGFWPILWETYDNLFTNMWRLKGEWQIIIANYTFLGNSHFTYIRILVPRCQNFNIILRKLNSKQQYLILICIENYIIYKFYKFICFSLNVKRFL